MAQEPVPAPMSRVVMVEPGPSMLTLTTLPSSCPNVSRSDWIFHPPVHSRSRRHPARRRHRRRRSRRYWSSWNRARHGRVGRRGADCRSKRVAGVRDRAAVADCQRCTAASGATQQDLKGRVQLAARAGDEHVHRRVGLAGTFDQADVQVSAALDADRAGAGVDAEAAVRGRP